MAEDPIPVLGIHGAPRSGTSWLGQIFNSSEQVAYRYQPFFSYAFRGRIREDSDAGTMREVFRQLTASRDPFLLQVGEGRLARETPTFPKQETTHLVYKEVRFHDLLPGLLGRIPEFRAIGLVRDPRATLASWFRAPREFDPGWDKEAEWRHAEKKNAGLRENWYGFERWKELASLFLDLAVAHEDRFRIVQYEDLVRDPRTQANALFEFCGLPFSAQVERFIGASTSSDDRDPYGVFRDRRRLGGSPRRRGVERDIALTIGSELKNTGLARFLREPDEAP